MRRRTDAIDDLLECWAGWRLVYEMYFGTGNSPLSWFLDPPGVRLYSSRTLCQGMIHSEMSVLNGRLVSSFRPVDIDALLVIYGTTGDYVSKSRYLKCSSRTLSRLRRRARRVAACLVLDKKT